MTENTITPDTANLTAFNPSDALPPPRYTGMLLPIERDKYGTKGNFELAVPQFVQSMIESAQLPGKAMRGELGIASIDNPLFTKGATQFTTDFGINLALLNAVRAPGAIKSGQLNIIASHNAKDGPKILKKHVDMIGKEGMIETFNKNKSFQDVIDGRLSFELDTSKMYIPKKFFNTKTFDDKEINAKTTMDETFKLTDILKGMPELFVQYPRLKKVTVRMSDDPDEVPQLGGAASAMGGEITLGKDLIAMSGKNKFTRETLEEVLMHEVQHLVDFIERRADGSNPAGVLSQISDGSEGYLRKTLKEMLANEIYRRNAGEVRARMVEQRLKTGLQDEFPDPDVAPENIIRNEDVLIDLVNRSKSVPKIGDVMKGQDDSFMRQGARSLLLAVEGKRDTGRN
tara:strand:- start:287 stop:1486 length:1200 start_codon:yes stop_codon:yes gene_type:complete